MNKNQSASLHVIDCNPAAQQNELSLENHDENDT